MALNPPVTIGVKHDLIVCCEHCNRSTSVEFQVPGNKSLDAGLMRNGIRVTHCALCWDEFDRSLAESYAEQP